MQISKLKFRNYRCFGPEETVIDLCKMTTLIGMNSAGKTAVLQALVKLFGRTPSERSLVRSDFHVPFEMKPEEQEQQELYIEAVIVFPELAQEDELARSTVPTLLSAMTVDGPKAPPYVRVCLLGKWEKGISIDGSIEQRTCFMTLCETDEASATEEERERRRMNLSALHRSMISVTYVPAIRDPASQLQNTSNAIFHRILQGLVWSKDVDELIAKQRGDTKDAFEKEKGFAAVQTILGTEWQRLHSDSRYNSIMMDFTPEDLASMFRKMEVRFFPADTGSSYDVSSLGDGLRSLFYLGLVRSLLEFEEKVFEEQQRIGARIATVAESEPGETETETQEERLFSEEYQAPLLTILAVEEPENHLSPHLLGRVVESLRGVAEKRRGQVVLTSHTPAIVGRVEPETIRYLRMKADHSTTTVHQVILPAATDEAFKYVKEAVKAYPELYFSRLVVLGEGDTEEIVIPKALEALDTTLDGGAISVVPLGGRHVNHFWKLLSELKIPYITILDLDFGRNTGGWNRIKSIAKKLISSKVVAESDILKKAEELKLSITDSLDLTIALGSEDLDEVTRWAETLEEWDVFFAAPLDMDFMLLQSFPDIYKTPPLVPSRGGPEDVPDDDTSEKDRSERVNKAAKQALKSDKANVNSYGYEMKSLMIWYVYHFLSRGKPSTHIMALAEIDQATFLAGMPAPLRRLVEKVKEKLALDPMSQVNPAAVAE